jgi:hypothetical protein
VTKKPADQSLNYSAFKLFNYTEERISMDSVFRNTVSTYSQNETNQSTEQEVV